MLVRTTLRWTSISFSMKVLGYIGDFSQKSPMQVRTESATFLGVGNAHDLSAENLGWRYLNSCGSYSAVCRRNFPIQGDVTLKRGTVAKLSYAKQKRVMLVCTTLGGTSIPFP